MKFKEGQKIQQFLNDGDKGRSITEYKIYFLILHLLTMNSNYFVNTDLLAFY